MTDYTEYEINIMHDEWELMNCALEALLDQFGVNSIRVGGYLVYRVDGYGVGVTYEAHPSFEAGEGDGNETTTQPG